MSTGRRAYDILRSYVNKFDHLDGLDRVDALAELDGPSMPRAKGVEPAASNEEYEVVVTRKPVENPKGLARDILGVTEGATFDQVRIAFEKLNRRSDPANFPDGSVERTQAENIRKRVYWAYKQLTENVSESEQRFRSLEIE